jgi:hypothetical protein
MRAIVLATALTILVGLAPVGHAQYSTGATVGPSTATAPGATGGMQNHHEPGNLVFYADGCPPRP